MILTTNFPMPKNLAELPLDYIVCSFNFSRQFSEDFEDPLHNFSGCSVIPLVNLRLKMPFDWESINKWWHERQYERYLISY